jgi:hypothetical protein
MELDVAWAVAHRDMELAFAHTWLVERAVFALGAFW